MVDVENETPTHPFVALFVEHQSDRARGGRSSDRRQPGRYHSFLTARMVRTIRLRRRILSHANRRCGE
jgi:hypothetical protein